MITTALPVREKPDTERSLDETATAWALAARTGDPAAVDHFVRALHRDVQRYVAYLCADPQAVDDLAQDTFLRALGSLHRFEGRSSARSWLLAIAR
ncbi:sigma factor, partial [Streptomyces sp. NPDC003832]